MLDIRNNLITFNYNIFSGRKMLCMDSNTYWSHCCIIVLYKPKLNTVQMQCSVKQVLMAPLRSCSLRSITCTPCWDPREHLPASHPHQLNSQGTAGEHVAQKRSQLTWSILQTAQSRAQNTSPPYLSTLNYTILPDTRVGTWELITLPVNRLHCSRFTILLLFLI